MTYICNNCEKKYKKKASYDKHVQECKIITKNIEHDENNKSMAFLSDKARDDLIEKNKIKYSDPSFVYHCKKCGRGFRTHRSYMVHINRPSPCDRDIFAENHDIIVDKETKDILNELNTPKCSETIPSPDDRQMVVDYICNSIISEMRSNYILSLKDKHDEMRRQKRKEMIKSGELPNDYADECDF